MKIGVMVKGYIPSPAPADLVYAPIELAMAIADGLVERGHTVDYFGPKGTKLDAATVVDLNLEPLVHNQADLMQLLANIAYHSDNVLSLWDSFLAREMFRRAAAGHYDVLHFHHYEVALPYAAQFPEVPVVYTMHDPIDKMQQRLLAMHQSANQRLVAISNQQRQTAPNLPYLTTIYNGVDTDAFAFSPRADEYLLFLGSILPRKGTKEAIEVARAAQRRLLIIGPTYPDNQAYFAEHVQPFLNDQIQYLGHVPHDKLLPYIQNAAALLMPIQWEEPFGMVMVEAMACGTPVIGLHRGSVPEVVEDGVTGFVVDTTEAMVAAVGQLSTIDRAATRQHAERHFSRRAMIDGYEKAFASLMKGK